MLLRLIPEIFSIADGIFLAIIDGLTVSISLIVLILIAIELRNSNNQLMLMKQNSIYDRKAHIQFTYEKFDTHVNLHVHNIGKGIAYQINVELTNINTSEKEKIEKVVRYDNVATNYILPIKNEHLYFHEKLDLRFMIKNNSKYRLLLYYKDDSQEEMFKIKYDFD
jgi:MoaA/NifB/PqqE/SkfB family radical SAM enzyme